MRRSSIRHNRLSFLAENWGIRSAATLITVAKSEPYARFADVTRIRETRKLTARLLWNWNLPSLRGSRDPNSDHVAEVMAALVNDLMQVKSRLDQTIDIS